jgi:hypothetical protein
LGPDWFLQKSEELPARAWVSFVETPDNRIVRLLLSTNGTETLKFGSSRGKSDTEVASLPAGRRIDMTGGVRCGIVGEPVPQAKSQK